MKPYLKKTSLLVLLHFLISLSTPLSPVWASQNPTGFKSASNGNFTVGCVNEGAGNPPNCSQCTNFCSDLDGNGISGSSTWNTTDDALCSDVGAPTSGGTFVTMPTPLPSYSNCTVNITAQVLTAVTTSPRWAGSTGDPCVEAQKLKDMCTFHNSQVQVQCQAVDALTGGSGPNANGVDPRAANLALMSMDFIIAALCTSAALVPIPALTLVCSGSAMAEGAAELGTTMQMLSGKTQDYLSVAFGGLGIAEGVGGTALSLKNGGFEKAKNWIEEASKDDANQKAEKISRGTSAVTAATFAALAGIRLANVIQMNSALSDACNAVNSLLGSANPPSSGNNNPSGNASNGPTASGGTGSGNSYSSSGGGSAGGTGSSGITTQSQLNSVNNCIAQGGTTTACLAAATGSGSLGADANLIGNSPQAQQQIQNAAGNLPAIAQQAMQGGAGAAMASLLPSGAGDVGAAIAGIAQVGQDEAAKLASGMGVSSGTSYSGGGGGGGSGGSSKSDSNPFGSLFGGGAAGGTAAPVGAGVATYGSPAGAPDIWHANTHMNIFEIVSDKLGKVSPRIQ